MMDYHNYYYEKIARNDGFWQTLEIDFRYETKATQQKQFVILTNFLVTSDSIQTTLFICDASSELR